MKPDGYLITGHRGFIGSNLMKYFYKNISYPHIKVFGYDIKDPSLPKHLQLDKNTIEELHNIVEDILTIVTDRSDLKTIYHVGAITDTQYSDPDIFLYNTEFTKALIDLTRNTDIQIIYSSTAAGYDHADDLNPKSLYAWSKLLPEQYGLLTHPNFISLRYFNVYGPEEHRKSIKMASVAYQATTKYAWSGEKFKLFPTNNHEISRDFVYVKDVVRANIHATHDDCKLINVPSGIYDVGTAHSRTFEEVLYNMDIPYEYATEDAIPKSYQYVTEAFESKFLPGWQPLYSLERGCEEYKHWLINYFLKRKT